MNPLQFHYQGLDYYFNNGRFYEDNGTVANIISEEEYDDALVAYLSNQACICTQ